MFEDVLYSYNDKRFDRAVQLAMDCNELTFELIQQKETLDRLLIQLNGVIREVYKHKDSLSFKKIKISAKIGDDGPDVDLWDPIVIDELAPCFTMPIVTDVIIICCELAALKAAGFVGHAVATDVEIGTAATEALIKNASSVPYESIEMVGVNVEEECVCTSGTGIVARVFGSNFSGFSTWGKFVCWGGSVVAFAVIFLAIKSISEAITGAIIMSKLQGLIHDMIEPRRGLKQSVMINDRLILSIMSLIEILNAVKDVPGITDDYINRIIRNIVENARSSLNTLTLDAATIALVDHDTKRSAWTDDDY